MGLSTNNNSVFKLKYKLVLKIKNASGIKRELFLKKITEMFLDISANYGVEKECIHLEKDALIIRFHAKPNTEISKFINTYKSATSRRVKREFEMSGDIKEFWGKGYLLLTIGNESEEAINQYIVNGK